MKLVSRAASKLFFLVPLIVLLTILAVPTPATAFAKKLATSSSSTRTFPCLQGNASLNVTKLSEEQLQDYGLPVRPLNANARAMSQWLQMANRIKTHHHICQLPTLTGPKAHHSSGFHPQIPAASSHNIIPNVTGYQNEIWAGNYAIQPLGSYVIAQANWTLPCVSTQTNPSSASEWIGLGGAGSDGNGRLIQAGDDELVDGSGNVTYTAWLEDFGSPDYSQTWQLVFAGCSDSVTAEVTSNFDSDGTDYFMLDTADFNFSVHEAWPLSDGSTGECIVENPNDKNQYTYFTDFYTITFTGCDINSTPIGELPHDYDNMYKNSHYLATTGPITNGDDYSISWKAAS